MMEIILFVSSTCPHCPHAAAVARKVIPQYEEYDIRYEKVRVQTSRGKELAGRYSISSVPTMLIFDNYGNLKFRITGVPSESSLRNKIETLLGLRKSFFSRLFKKN